MGETMYFDGPKDCIWNPTGRARGTMIARLRQKTATARHPSGSKSGPPGGNLLHTWPVIIVSSSVSHFCHR